MRGRTEEGPACLQKSKQPGNRTRLTRPDTHHTGIRKGILCRTRRSTAPQAARPAGTLSRKTSPLNSPVAGG